GKRSPEPQLIPLAIHQIKGRCDNIADLQASGTRGLLLMRSLLENFLFSVIIGLALSFAAFGQDAGKNGKRNARPQQAAAEAVKPSADGTGPTYRYEFSQPNFVVSHILIEHGADGNGTITFDRKDYEE